MAKIRIVRTSRPTPAASPIVDGSATAGVRGLLPATCFCPSSVALLRSAFCVLCPPCLLRARVQPESETLRINWRRPKRASRVRRERATRVRRIPTVRANAWPINLPRLFNFDYATRIRVARLARWQARVALVPRQQAVLLAASPHHRRAWALLTESTRSSSSSPGVQQRTAGLLVSRSPFSSSSPRLLFHFASAPLPSLTPARAPRPSIPPALPSFPPPVSHILLLLVFGTPPPVQVHNLRLPARLVSLPDAPCFRPFTPASSRPPSVALSLLPYSKFHVPSCARRSASFLPGVSRPPSLIVASLPSRRPRPLLLVLANRPPRTHPPHFPPYLPPPHACLTHPLLPSFLLLLPASPAYGYPSLPSRSSSHRSPSVRTLRPSFLSSSSSLLFSSSSTSLFHPPPTRPPLPAQSISPPARPPRLGPSRSASVHNYYNRPSPTPALPSPVLRARAASSSLRIGHGHHLVPSSSPPLLVRNIRPPPASSSCTRPYPVPPTSLLFLYPTPPLSRLTVYPKSE
ncbi:hypothetical protein B0H17DRAFT_1326702 [Mycena rosella]|uniref:Uncharacterized protein n=1 Tax=Mycena rosella TaxID=1033263 RepID=A0AAD7GRW6_MYCRO|nr:hypothetical protein B0H17DRAFT_1326702 [Mycena rosella]